MDNAQVLDILRSGILVALKLSAPLLGFSMLIGVLIAVLQAATQIHEQTLTFVPKLLVVAAVMLFAGSWMMETMQEYTIEVFSLMQQS